MNLKCLNCDFKAIRGKFPAKHVSRQCLKALIDKKENINREMKNIKKRRCSLLAKFEENNFYNIGKSQNLSESEVS